MMEADKQEYELTERVSSQDRAFLKGLKVYLRPFEREDLPLVLKWVNDPELRADIGEVLPRTAAGAQEWFEQVCADKQRVWFAVVEASTDAVVGEAGLLRINPAWRRSDLTLIIGEPEARSRGYGTEAALLLMDWAFGSLNMHRLAVGVAGFNRQALCFYEKLGFSREGVERDGYYHNHEYHDFIMLSILEAEFRARYPDGIEAALGNG